MKPSVKYAAAAFLLIVCVLSVQRCQRRMGSREKPELSLYTGLGTAVAEELQRQAPGAGPRLLIALDPATHPRYAAMVDAFKRTCRETVITHFLPSDELLNLEGDGLSVSKVREILAQHPEAKSLAILGGGFGPSLGNNSPPLPPTVAGPNKREVAVDALAKGQLAAAIVYREPPGYIPDGKPTEQFNASFEILK